MSRSPMASISACSTSGVLLRNNGHSATAFK